MQTGTACKRVNIRSRQTREKAAREYYAAHKSQITAKDADNLQHFFEIGKAIAIKEGYPMASDPDEKDASFFGLSFAQDIKTLFQADHLQ